MASINGIQLKGVKTFVGREGDFCQGNVYVDSKKVGFWSEDGDGGCDFFDFDEKKYDERVQNFKDSLIDYPYINYVDFSAVLGALMLLNSIEKDAKKHFKNGVKAIIASVDKYHARLYFSKEDASDEELKKKCKELLGHETVFRSLDDFNVTVDKFNRLEIFDV